MGDVDTSAFDEPGFVARHNVQRAIEMDDQQAGINELNRLIAEGLDVSALGCDADGLSVFFWAASRGRTALAAALIDAGATLEREVAARDVPSGNEDSALHAAAEQGNIEMVKLLLSAGGKPLLAKFNYVDKTPLHIAARRGDLAMVKLLISAGSNANAINEANIGFSPLDEAVESGSVEVVRWLLGAGADPLGETWMRMTPVDRAVDKGVKGQAMLEEFRKKLKMPEKQWKLLTQRKKK